MQPQRLKTERLILRQWRDDDLRPYAALNADPRVRQFFPFALTPNRSDEEAAVLRKDLAANGWGAWAVEVIGKVPFAGWVGLGPPDFQGLPAPFKVHSTPLIEIGWRLAYECWGCGYATEAATAVAEFGFKVLDLPEIISFAPTGNLRSRKVMSKIGMIHDPDGDFFHPCAPPNHPFRPLFMLYRLRRSDFEQRPLDGKIAHQEA
jgi:RimJ/RimL family protein N-acetyltransferase